MMNIESSKDKMWRHLKRDPNSFDMAYLVYKWHDCPPWSPKRRLAMIKSYKWTEREIRAKINERTVLDKILDYLRL